MFRRNLFKFTVLKSFKIVWVVSVVLFTCVIASAHVGQMGKEKAVVQCIENLKFEVRSPRTGGKYLKLSFTTRERVRARVRVQKWGSERPEEKPDWLEVAYGSEYDDVDKQADTDHIFGIGLSKVDGKIPGGKYRLVLNADVFKTTVVDWGRMDDVLVHRYNCEKEISLFKPGNPLNNLRLRGPKKPESSTKPMPKLPLPPDLLGRPRRP